MCTLLLTHTPCLNFVLGDSLKTSCFNPLKVKLAVFKVANIIASVVHLLHIDMSSIPPPLPHQSPAPGKKGKGSPAKAKGAPPPEAPPTEPTVTVETPEQLAHRQRTCQLHKEHRAAIEKEGSHCDDLKANFISNLLISATKVNS